MNLLCRWFGHRNLWTFGWAGYMTHCIRLGCKHPVMGCRSCCNKEGTA